MAEDKQTGPGFTGGNWILLAAAAVGTVYVSLHTPPLRGSRPAATLEFEVQDRESTQHVDAHLWQDPLAAAVQHAKDEEKEEQTQKSRCCYHAQDVNSTAEEDRRSHSIQALSKKIQDRKPLIVGIAVPGGPYAEDGEARLRLRYAVVSALDVAKYVPYDEDHIGYVNMKSGAQKPAPSPIVGVSTASESPPTPPRQNIPVRGPPPVPDIIPFEWFHKGNYLDQNNSAVLLLWIDERALFTSPISTLADLDCQLVPSSLEGSGLGFALIGPQQSRTLARMASELHTDSFLSPVDCGYKQLSLFLKNFLVYNSAATIEEQLFLKEANLAGSDISQIFSEIHYYRTIATDDTLAQALVAELKLRQVDPRASADHIALVSEWDTLYGRTLPEVVTACLRNDKCVSGDPPLEENLIHKFSYLRGLDGQLPHAKSANADTAPNHGSHDDATAPGRDQPTGSPSDGVEDRERAEGQGQFDYLRRLAHHIQTLDKALRQEGKGNIKAIGILGSDVYDKLVILQALRPEFPEAQFFTNDLDALLLPQGKTRQTRDLLVASSFGLSLRDEWQKDVPPFRNTYQTAAFLATQLALVNGAKDSLSSDLQERLGQWLKPQLFVIGRTGAYALPVNRNGREGRPPADTNIEVKKKAHACKTDILKCKYINPVEAKLYPEFLADSSLKVGVGSFIVIAFLTLALSARNVRQFVMGPIAPGPPLSGFTPKRLVRFSLPLAMAIVIAAGIVAFWPWIGDHLTQNGQGEPMFLLEGISIWPATVLRLASAFIGLFLIRYALRSLKRNQMETFTEMHLPNKFYPMAPPGRRRRTSLLRNIRLGSLRRLPSVQEDAYPPYPIFRFIVQLHYRALPGLRLLRALAATLAMMSLGFLIGLIFGFPYEPARGVLAKDLYITVTVVDVFLSFLLTFLVVDATLLCRLFIYELRRVCSKWPRETIAYYGSQYQVSWSALSDWIDMEFIAKRTKCITALIYLPFIAMALLVLSRNDIFTNFSVSVTLVIIWLILGLIVIGSAISLRSAAEAARRIAIKNLNTRLIAAQGRQSTRTAAQLQTLLAGVENLRDGAFAPWSSQPVVRAFFLPLLTYGASVLVHGYALPGF